MDQSSLHFNMLCCHPGHHCVLIVRKWAAVGKKRWAILVDASWKGGGLNWSWRVRRIEQEEQRGHVSKANMITGQTGGRRQTTTKCHLLSDRGADYAQESGVLGRSRRWWWFSLPYSWGPVTSSKRDCRDSWLMQENPAFFLLINPLNIYLVCKFFQQFLEPGSVLGLQHSLLDSSWFLLPGIAQ